MPKEAKPGRPRKPPEDLTSQLAIRLTPVEREALGSLAVRDGRSLSGYIAHVLRGELERPRRDVPADETSDLPSGETRQLAIRMNSSEREKVQRRATEEGRSLSGYIARMLRLHLERTSPDKT